jgi:hypothetical protein
MKAVITVGLVVISLFFPLVGSQSVSAAPVCPGTGGGGTIGTFTSCQESDKLYTLISTTLPGDSGLSITSANGPGTEVLHIIALNFGSSLIAPGTYTLEYTISITSTGPSFLDASIDTTVPGAGSGVSVVKNIFDSTNTLVTTLTSTNGGPDGPNSLGSGLTFLDVVETFTLGSGAVLSGATNTYTEINARAAEPATLILLGLGLVGAGVLRRKKVI